MARAEWRENRRPFRSDRDWRRPGGARLEEAPGARRTTRTLRRRKVVKMLIDEDGLDAQDATLAALFRVAKRAQIDHFRKRRVFASLERARGRGLRRFWLRPVLVSAVLVSGTAAASVGQQYYVSHGMRLFGLGESPVRQRSKAPTLAPASASRTTPSLGDASNSDAPSELGPKASELLLNALHPATRNGLRAHPDQNADAAHVVEAIQALRTEADPARAQGLLRAYLGAHPRGVLAEDALALAIEAASKLHDGRAADYSRRYLAQFPHGKYRNLASRALELAE
jgi:hypothetical protein